MIPLPVPPQSLPVTRSRLGRPTTYSIEIAAEICALLGDNMKLHDICRETRFPSAATVYRWLIEYPDFRKAYDCALQAKFDARSEEIIAIADDASRDFIQEPDAEGILTVRPNKELLERTKLRIETRKWQMQKELPHKYADTQPITISSPVSVEKPDAIADQRQPRRTISLGDAMALYERETVKASR
jgi:hypothetical protein